MFFPSPLCLGGVFLAPQLMLLSLTSGSKSVCVCAKLLVWPSVCLQGKSNVKFGFGFFGTFWIWLLWWHQASDFPSLLELWVLGRRGKGRSGSVITSDSTSRRDSLDKSGFFPEWKKMSAPRSQAEKVNFRLLVLPSLLSLFFFPSFPSLFYFLPSFPSFPGRI